MSLLATILAAEGAAEHSKTAFYVAGGVLAAWAVVVSALGITRPDFPANAVALRMTMLVSVVLMAGAMSTAVLTA
jgi:hypothetical protein